MHVELAHLFSDLTVGEWVWPSPHFFRCDMEREANGKGRLPLPFFSTQIGEEFLPECFLYLFLFLSCFRAARRFNPPHSCFRACTVWLLATISTFCICTIDSPQSKGTRGTKGWNKCDKLFQDFARLNNLSNSFFPYISDIYYWNTLQPYTPFDLFPDAFTLLVLTSVPIHPYVLFYPLAYLFKGTI
jgi:hypothetical protein